VTKAVSTSASKSVGLLTHDAIKQKIAMAVVHCDFSKGQNPLQQFPRTKYMQQVDYYYCTKSCVGLFSCGLSTVI